MSSEASAKATLAIIAARHNIALIRDWAAHSDLDALRADVKTRYAIERAFIAIDASLKDVPANILAAHAIPAHLVAGFRNALAHTYDDILDERVILTIREDLPNLDAALAAMLATR